MREPVTLYQRIRVVEECKDVWFGATALAAFLAIVSVTFAANARYRVAATIGVLAAVCVGVAIGASLIERRFTR